MKKRINTFLLLTVSAFLLTGNGSLFSSAPRLLTVTDPTFNAYSDIVQTTSPSQSTPGRAVAPAPVVHTLVYPPAHESLEFYPIKIYATQEYFPSDSPLKAFKYALQLYTADY